LPRENILNGKALEVKMAEIIFWDVDTQYDFMISDGKLYVPEAEEIIPRLEALTAFARKMNIPIWGSVDYHDPDDPEISPQPDFQETFPPHCLKDTPGQEKIPATRPINPLWIDSQPLKREELHRLLQNHFGEVFFRKQRFDVFSNPNVIPALEFIQPKEVVIYGVALDVCDAYAVEGFLKMGKFKVTLVQDATKPIHVERGRELLKEWQQKGVRIVTTEEILKQE